VRGIEERGEKFLSGLLRDIGEEVGEVDHTN
jgi:hypothetical protein